MNTPSCEREVLAISTPGKSLHVFDLDGTLIRVNSFRVITRRFAFHLLHAMRFRVLARIGGWWVMKRLIFGQNLKVSGVRLIHPSTVFSFGKW